jgi:hypothetical protein
MARFAKDCMVKMNMLVKHLEVKLGPDTGKYQIRQRAIAAVRVTTALCSPCGTATDDEYFLNLQVT